MVGGVQLNVAAQIHDIGTPMEKGVARMVGVRAFLR